MQLNKPQMNLKTLFLLLTLSSLSLTVGSAQIDLKKIAKDTERSINNRVERGIERSVDGALDGAEDKVRGKNKKKKKGSQEEATNTVTVIKEVLPFNFSGNVTISIEGSGEVENNLIKVVSDKYQMAVRPMLVKKPHNLMIYDKQIESITKINTELYDDKALKEFHTYEKYDSKKTKTEFTKTSDIKEVMGFIARRYEVEGDDYEGEIWLSAEVDLDYDLFASLMQYQRLDLGTMHGFPLEMYIEFNNGETMDLTIKEIQDGEPEKNLFDVDGYELVDMTDLKSGN